MLLFRVPGRRARRAAYNGAQPMKRLSRFLARFLLLVVFCAGFQASIAPSVRALPARQQGLEDILRYIDAGWDNLSRSMSSCRTVIDPKAPDKSILYFPADVPVPASIRELEKKCGVRIEHLPAAISRLGDLDINRIEPHGLLYLPNPYVVPGGMFNEMYGWDSYFILRGLLREGRVDLARGIVENFFFEIAKYGGVLNANRGYVLTRSQPPFLTSMVRAVYDAEKTLGGADKAWLEKSYPYAVQDYELWTRAPHLAGHTGLSRYFGMGDGPVPELGAESNAYYRDVARYFLLHPGEAGSYLTRAPNLSQTDGMIGPAFQMFLCDSATGATNSETGCDKVETIALTKDFYKGDRSMRESGFDISFRFGAYGAATHHFAPVGLNSLLYKVEKDLEWMSAQLGRKQDANRWAQRAETRRQAMEKYFWNRDRGLYFDYDFTTNSQSSYIYATTFYPLWVGLATPEEAKAIAKNLKLFEQPGGLLMSREETSAQWDYPYGWAPIQLIAIEGLRRYGFDEEANRISVEFLSTVLENFRRDGTIREKYNVVTRSSETQVKVGYTQNVIGFGWTNGVFLELLQALPEKWKSRVEGGNPSKSE